MEFLPQLHAPIGSADGKKWKLKTASHPAYQLGNLEDLNHECTYRNHSLFPATNLETLLTELLNLPEILRPTHFNHGEDERRIPLKQKEAAKQLRGRTAGYCLYGPGFSYATMRGEGAAMGLRGELILSPEQVEALLTHLAKVEPFYGASKAGFSGMRPSFGFGKELITSEICVVQGSDPVFPRGTWRLVGINLPYGEVFDDAIHPRMPFGINVGGWQVGRGVVEEILEIYRDPRNQHILDAT